MSTARHEASGPPAHERGARDHTRIVVVIAVVAVIAMVSSAVIGIARQARSHHRAAPAAPVHTARIVTTISVGRGVPAIVMRGVYDFDHDVAIVRQDDPNVSGGGKNVGPEYVEYGAGGLYERISPAMATGLPDRVRRDARWIATSDPGAPDPFGYLNPFDGLARLRRKATEVRDLGTAGIEGRVASHYLLTIPRPSPVITGGAVGASGLRYDVYVSDGRLLRETITDAGTREPSYRYAFSEFGLPMHVTAPRADGIVDDADVSPRAPKLTGAWARVASGNSGGYAWKLYRAPADHERECWSLEAAPALHQPASSNGGTIVAALGPLPKPIPAVTRDGRTVTCSRTGIWASPLQIVAQGTDFATGYQLTVGIVGDGVERVDVGTLGSKAVRPIVVDPRFHGFVVVTHGPGGFALHRSSSSVIECGDEQFLGSPDAQTCPSLDD